MLGLPPDKTGRTGLWKIDVTPVVYLQLRKKMESGDATYNKVQLQMALSRYMQQNKGPWNQDQAQTLTGLDAFAEKHVDGQMKKYNLEKNKIDKSDSKPSAKVQKKLAVFKQLGLLPLDDKDLPKELRDDKLSPAEQQKRTASHIEQTLSVGSVIGKIAMHEPSLLVAEAIAVDTVMEGATTHIANTMIDSYKSKAKNAPEKDVLISGLDELMGEAERLKLQREIADLHANETDQKYQKKLHELKPQHVEEKCAMFRDNGDMAKVPVYETPKPAAKQTFLDTPYALPSFKDGPKPPTWIYEKEKK
jgi:hypothetical protein